MKTLYEVLGVRKNASQKSIQKAYRRLAMENHPDRGGDPLAFQEVAQAYKILSDPARREHYDQTGEICPPEAEDAEERKHLGILSKVFSVIANEMFQKNIDPSHNDVLMAMRAYIEKDIRILLATKHAETRALSTLAKMKGRFELKEDGVNLMDEIIQINVTGTQRQVEANAKQLELLQNALPYLNRFTYRMDGTGPSGVSAASSRTYITFMTGS